MSILTKLPEERYSAGSFDGVNWGSKFDIGAARGLMWLSQLAYETDEPSKIKRILTRWGMELVGGDQGVLSAAVKSILPLASTHAIVVAGRSATIVAFAGTDPVSVANWITNFNARIGWEGTAEGYTIAVDAILPSLEPLLRDRPAGSKVYVTGHSLGGALAAITARRIRETDLADVEAVYTFGMPRPGSAEFAAEYNALALGPRTYRLVHGEDLVPTVAPTSFNFRHVGRHLHCDRGGKFAQALLANDTNSDEPPFVEGVVRELSAWLHEPLSNIFSVLDRWRLATGMALGRGPTDRRSDAVGLAIELLPPRIRDHVPERYLTALT